MRRAYDAAGEDISKLSASYQELVEETEQNTETQKRYVKILKSKMCEHVQEVQAELDNLRTEIRNARDGSTAQFQGMSLQLEQTEGIVNQLQAQGNNTKTKARDGPSRTAAENKDLRAMVNKLELQVNCLTSQQKQDRTDTRMIFKAIEKEFSELSLTTRADQGVDDTTEELQDRFISRKEQQERQV